MILDARRLWQFVGNQVIERRCGKIVHIASLPSIQRRNHRVGICG